VGQNLQDHLQIRAVFKVQNTVTLNTLANAWWSKAAMGLEYLWSRSGPLSMAPSQLGAFTRSDPSKPYPNIQYHVQPLSLDAFGSPLHTFNAVTASVCNLNPTSRGTIAIKTPEFTDAPAIAPNYLSTDADRKVAADSLRVTRNILSQDALQRFNPVEHKPGVQYQTDAELAQPGRRYRQHDFPSGGHHQNGAQRRPHGGSGRKTACFGSVGCVSSMRGSCRSSPAAIPIRLP
jgi:choline dehydrogenase